MGFTDFILYILHAIRGIDWIIFILAVLIFLAGAVFLARQVFTGLDESSLNDKYVWGMNIQGFYFLSSVGTGILTVLSVYMIYSNMKADQEILRIPSMIAFACLLSSQMLMGADLGRPLRALKIVTGKNLLSPLTLDFMVLTIQTLLAFLFMFHIFTGIAVIALLWSWVTLLISLFGMVIHTLLFIPRVGAGYQSEPFQSALTFAGSILAGASILSLASFTEGSGETAFFRLVMIAAAAVVLVASVGSVWADLLADNKPHNLILSSASLVIVFLLFAQEVITGISYPLMILTVVCNLITVYFEKHQTVLHLQQKPVMPPPYNQYEKKLLYRPSLSEVLILCSGISAVVVITYVVILVNAAIELIIKNVF